MTKKTLNYTLIILLLAGFITTNLGCGKVSDIPDGDDNPPQYAISSDKTTVSPFETVTLTIEDYIFTEESYLASIYDRDVKLIKISDTQLTFMMPYIADGERIMEFIIEDVSHEIYFTITSPEPVSNPEEVIDSYKQNVVVAFDSLVLMNQLYNLQIEPQNLQVIENYLNDFNQAYATATAEEKQELAQFMNANPDIFDFSNFDYSFFNDSLNTSKNFVKWDQQLTHDMQYFTGLVLLTGATVGLFNGALISLNPIAIFITGGALVTEMVLLKRQTKTILNRSYKPFEFDINNELRSTLEFENDVQFQLGIDGTYRTLYNNDQSSSSVIIELVANINTVTGYWNTVTNNISGTTGTVSNLVDINSYNVNVNESSVTPQYISIENISNSNVVLSNYNTTNTVYVTFTTTAEEDQDFTFDIVYNNPDFSEERINVNAKVLVPVFDFTGFWNLSYYTMDVNGDEYLHQEERFTCNSSGYASSSEVRYPTSSPPNNTWQPAGELTLSYYNSQIVISESAGFYVQVNDLDDNIFYSSNWNINYELGDYYWKIKLER